MDGQVRNVRRALIIVQIALAPLLLNGAGTAFAHFDPAVVVNLVDEGYFSAPGVHVLAGRPIRSSDRASSPRVAVLNETAARLFFLDEDPVGQRLRLSLGGSGGDWVQIVGVVEDVREDGLEDPAAPAVYLSYRQFSYLASAPAPYVPDGRHGHAAFGRA